jgi:hypothetical protein
MPRGGRKLPRKINAGHREARDCPGRSKFNNDLVRPSGDLASRDLWESALWRGQDDWIARRPDRDANCQEHDEPAAATSVSQEFLHQWVEGEDVACDA